MRKWAIENFGDVVVEIALADYPDTIVAAWTHEFKRRNVNNAPLVPICWAFALITARRIYQQT